MTKRPGRTAAKLLLGTALIAPLPAAAQVLGPESPTRRLASQWSVDLRATYTDNYRRVDDELTRSFFGRSDDGIVFPIGETVPVTDADTGLPLFIDPVTGEQTTTETALPVTRFVPARETLDIEPPDNVVFTASLSGGTVYERPGLTGIVTGALSISAYADQSSLDGRLSDDLDSPAGAGVLPTGVTDEDIAFATFGLDREEEIFIRPNITGSATARIVDDLLYVDVAAIAQQQTISNRNAFATEADGRIGNTTTFVGGSVSPYVNRPLGVGGTVEARYRLSGVAVADEDFRDEGAFAGQPTDPDSDGDEELQFANDSIAQEALLEYRSDDLFDRLAFTLRGAAARSDESGSDVLDEIELNRLTGAGEITYDLGRSIALTGELGYDEVDVEETDRNAPAIDNEARNDALSGIFWAVGAEYAPTRRTRVRLSVGERFGGTEIDGSLSFRPTPRLTVTGSADRQLGTGTNETFEGFRGINSRTLQIVEQLAQVQTGSARELLDRAVGFQGGFSNIQRQQIGVAVRNSYAISAAYTARRTDFSASVNFTDSEFGDGDANRGNKRFAIQAGAQRQVTRRASLGITGRYERVEGILPEEVILLGRSQDADSDQIFVSVDGSYRIGPSLSATARAYHIASDGFAGFGTGREYTENAVSAGIRWTF